MMEQRYQLFKSDVNFDSSSTPTSTPFQYASKSHNTHPSQQAGIENWNQKFPKWKQILGDDISKLPTGTTQSALLLQNSQQTAVSQLANVLNSTTPLRSKCEQISRMLSSFSNKELIELYPSLLVEIFAFSGSESFGLNKYEPRKYFYEFNTAFNFLSTSGCLFKAINKLMVDPDAEFHFPYKGLPAGITEKIKNGHISLWYQKKLTVVPGNEVVLACNALEYYLLLFAYYVIHPHTLQCISQWSGVEDVLYIRLLEDYLKYFFPIDGVKHSNSTASPEGRPRSSSSLWKTCGSPVQNESGVQASVLLNLLPSSHSEVFLQILCDIWFGLNPEKQFEQEQEYKLPSVDHARVVRILVKYLHTFVNGNNDLQMVLLSFSHSQQLDELKSVVIPALLYKPLYIYLQHCFTHWPLDGSFRMVLETWLSFIQPWRYRDTSNKTLDDSVCIDITLWKPFVGENTLFYSSLFQMFLLRALRFDMTSLHDVQLVYRVAKVFSQPSLSEFLQDEMEPQLPCQMNVRSVGGPMFLGLMSNAKKIQPGEVVPQIFGPEITKHVKDLCQMLASTVMDIRKLNSQKVEGTKNSGIIASIKEFFLIDDTTDFDRDREKQRLIEYLEQSCHLFSTTFKLPQFQTMPNPNGDQLADGSAANISGSSVSFSDDTLPEFMVTEHGVELTDVGRYQILQGIRQFPITYSGDPELQPIRSYESELAVKGLYWLSCRLNGKYSELLNKYYNQPGYISRFLRRFSKRLLNNHYIDTPFHLPQHAIPTDKVTPRISMRFAASYYFMGYACWVTIIARLFGFSWLLILFAVLVLGIVSIVAHIDSPPKKFKES